MKSRDFGILEGLSKHRRNIEKPWEFGGFLDSKFALNLHHSIRLRFQCRTTLPTTILTRMIRLPSPPPAAGQERGQVPAKE